MSPFHAIAVSTVVLLSTPLTAAQPAQTDPHHPPIMVEGPAPTLAAWSGQVTRALENKLRFPASLAGQEPHEGVVRVRFVCSDTGRPSNISVQSSSGAHDLDREAMRAIGRIPTLHPLPEGLARDQRYEALVMFANSPDRHRRQMAAAKREVAASAERYGRRAPDLAMGIMLVPAGAP